MSKVIKSDLKLLIINFFKKNGLDYSKNSFLLAVSGGADSMVLLELFIELKANFAVAHCNYKLREKDSEDDYRLVKEYCEVNKIQFYYKQFNTKIIAETEKKSIQEAARDLRYNWFNEIVEINKINYLVTAHHLNDSVETILFNLIRGTGIRGLIGIPSNLKNVLRPLIDVKKNDILNYAALKNIRFREDKSNLESDYTRNYIRNEVLISLEKKIPNSISGIAKTSKNLLGLSKLLENQILLWQSIYFKFDKDEIIHFRLLDFVKREPLFSYFLFDLLQEFGANNSMIEEILDALKNNRKGGVWNSENYCFTINKESLLIKAKKHSQSKSVFFSKSVILDNGETKIVLTKITATNIDFKKLNNAEIFVDKDKLSFPLEIRSWKIGDLFYPFGIKGKKKLSDFFIDRKLSKFEKEKVLLLCSNQKIVWIVGMAADRRFAIEPNSKNLVSINV